MILKYQAGGGDRGFTLVLSLPRQRLPLPLFLFYLLFPLSGMLFPPFCPLLPFSSGFRSQLSHPLFRKGFLPHSVASYYFPSWSSHYLKSFS